MILLRVVDAINTAIGKTASFLIWAGIFVLCFEVVARYAFGQPTLWAHGYTQRIFGAYTVLIGAYTLIRNDHVRVDLLLNNRSVRGRAALDLVNFSFLIIWGVVLTWEGFGFFEDAWAYNERDDSVLRHPMWPVKLTLFFGAAMITLQGIVEALRCIILLINPRADVRRSEAI
ncbi:MAG TPA: TRAP transporter small permease subunit [Paracoccus sp.]|nr:TRAP transporter small permease subunit [Paracoccus sp. (in: a-proteobacteria)]